MAAAYCLRNSCHMQWISSAVCRWGSRQVQLGAHAAASLEGVIVA